MTTVIARRIASTPTRTASETWAKIVDLLASDIVTRNEMAASAGVGCSSISSEATKEAAIVIWGGGLRVRVYCLFGEDAITGDDVNEEPLPRPATDGNWQMSIPCLPEDVAWCVAELKSSTSHITARSMYDDVVDEEPEVTVAAASIKLNLAEFLKS